jgi:tetratricopeptide repeat protein
MYLPRSKIKFFALWHSVRDGSISLSDAIASLPGQDLRIAEMKARQMLALQEKVSGKEHPETLRSMANLASIYRYQGRWKEAEELNVQVMETRKRVLGEDHPDTLTSMVNLAFTLRSQSRNQEALSLIRTCFEVQRRVIGPRHPDTESSLKTLNKWQMENIEIGV